MVVLRILLVFLAHPVSMDNLGCGECMHVCVCCCVCVYICLCGFVNMLNRNEKFFSQYGWGPLEMAEGRGPLGNRHPAPRLLRP